MLAMKLILKTSKMKTANSYIRNTKTDETFDTMEGKFYPSNWESTLETLEYVKQLFNSDVELFENCEIVTIDFNN